uniref:Uncharacterized protein n=1 Tax=Panagrolaimus sp. PS1159 TaxID=55785 RepID=A0AC35G2T1_9BILA
MSDSDIESYYQVSTAHSTSRGSFSEYSDVPSETAVDVIESLASTLSLVSCIVTSVSEYSMPPSETEVSFTQLNTEELQNVAAADAGTLLNDQEEDGPSYYSLPPDETIVEMETCDMLYPQRYIPVLYAPERDECDTPAPPEMC